MDPILRKKMIVCTPFGKFENGDQTGDMTPARIKAIVARFKKYPRQVSVYALGDHVRSLDDRIVDGWVEGLEVDSEGRMIADVKILGSAVQLVLGDRIRLASIATVQGKNPDGTAQGEVLQHVLLTNDAFDKQANIQIAAALAKGAELFAYFTTALSQPQEADMAEKELHDEIARLKEDNAALRSATADEKVSASLKETQTLLAEQVREVAELTASNANLRADVERMKSPKVIEDMAAQLKAQDRQIRASKIRRLVSEGVRNDSGESRFSREQVGNPSTGWNHTSDEMVLAWFKASIFQDSVDRLEFAIKTYPVLKTGRTFGNGEGVESTGVSMTEDDKALLVRLGRTPEQIMAALKSRSASEYQAATATK